MAISSTGPISFSDLQNEFGGSNPVSLSEYYVGVGYVPNDSFATNGGQIPASGTISAQNFLGTRNPHAYTLTSSGSFTVPANVVAIKVFAVGGGGGGQSYSNGGGYAGGGSGGGLSYAQITTTPGQVINYTVGAGGSPDTNGGATSFSTVSAPGGNRGNRFGIAGGGGNVGTGGSGGADQASGGAGPIYGGVQYSGGGGGRISGSGGAGGGGAHNANGTYYGAGGGGSDPGTPGSGFGGLIILTY